MTNELIRHITDAVRARGPQPLSTFYGPAGDRTELSYATLDNWASKVANWLVEEHLQERGGICDVSDEGGWRTLVTVVGCWKAGVGAVPAPGGLVAEDHVLVYADDYDDPDLDGSEPALRIGEREWSAQQLLDDAVAVPTRGRVATALGAEDPALWQLLVGVLVARGALVWAPGTGDDTLQRHAGAERASHLFDRGGLASI